MQTFVCYKCLYFYHFKESEISSATNTLLEKETDKSLKDADKDEDISTALEKEISELRTEREMPLTSRKFQVYLCQNCRLNFNCINKIIFFLYNICIYQYHCFA